MNKKMNRIRKGMMVVALAVTCFGMYSCETTTPLEEMELELNETMEGIDNNGGSGEPDKDRPGSGS